MTEWDPYYLDRGLLRPDQEEKKRLMRQNQRGFEETRAQRKEDNAAANEALDGVVATLISAEQVALFERLDVLEAANTEALIKIAEDIEKARERVESVLERAFVLPDGRSVFKSEDGSRVVDEFGEDVSPEVVSPDAIDDSYPTWEEFKRESEALERLDSERDELLKEQERLDVAREQAEAGDLTTADVDALEAELGPSSENTPTNAALSASGGAATANIVPTNGG